MSSPPLTTALSQEARCAAQTLPWHVVHACERVRDALDVAESQLTVGMRPFLLTPTGGGSAALYLEQQQQDLSEPDSLLTAWGQVRGWRKSLLQIEAEGDYLLLHAHSFASGMASVRSSLVTVYDLRAFVEQLATARGNCDEKSWLARSFRVAEQFILARAAAVVVHTPVLKAACAERGAPLESVFYIPDPIVVTPALPAAEDLLRSGESEFIVFAPDCAAIGQDDEALQVLTAFEMARRQYREAQLVLAPHQSMTSRIEAEIARLKLAGCIKLLTDQAPTDHARMMRAADVIISGACAAAGAYAANDHPLAPAHRDALPSSTCLAAMAAGRALLAADSPQNRNVSPDGRGLLWYSVDSPHDLAHRLLYLAHNRDLCRSLGAAAREYMTQTRSAAAVGRQYDAVYRHASQKRRDRQPLAPNRMALEPAFGE